ncbi:MAG: response regulator transcription factor [Chloroflexota bacterium]|jgi:two-component system KDP operon response regulator KdpE
MLKKVLLIDDDPDLGRLVEMVLRPIEIILYQSYSGGEGLRRAYELHPDLVILDVMMPHMDGFEVCTRLRELSKVPVLMLTASGDPRAMIRGFNLGVDDFIKKPFLTDELEARVRALLRRSEIHDDRDTNKVIAYRDNWLEVDLISHTVRLDGNIVELTPREYGLLDFLVREQGKILTHAELVKEAWGEPFISSAHTISSLYIFYLRKKIQDGLHGHQYIHTFWGRGYWFEPRQA